MNKKLEKVKVFVKEHKVEIACAVGAAALGVVAKHKLNNQETVISIIPKPKKSRFQRNSLSTVLIRLMSIVVQLSL